MTTPPRAALEILAGPEALAQRTAAWLLDIAIAQQGIFAVALSGGSTPRGLYEHLARPPYAGLFPWGRTHWFWGDERFVPHDSPSSNYRMVREALLSRVPIPSQNIHAVTTVGLDLEAAAIAYQRELKDFYGVDRLDPVRALFDVTLLGLGADGHTASLFPGTPALSERDRWVAGVVKEQGEPRITLTYPALESSRHVAFLIAGQGKREIFARLRHADQTLPAAHLHPTGSLTYFADAAAAGHE